jgi:prepilin-type N-terminal cleavage/methylation domain-containing protein/prepilin-type processing-associated H-X9-DG protein
MARKGFTLVELLVVIAIIGILAGLILPAVQMVREQARRTECSNRMKQLSVAALQHTNSYTILPNAGHAHDSLPTFTSSLVPHTGDRQVAGWAYQILPFLEQKAVWDGVGAPDTTVAQRQANAVKAKLTVFFCPSRGLPRVNGGRGLIDFCSPTYSNSQLNDIKNVPGPDTGPVPPKVVPRNVRPRESQSVGAIVRNFNTPTNVANNNITSYSISLAGINDGTSNTILFGEKQMNVARIPGSEEDNNGYAAGFDVDTVRSCQKVPASDIAKSADPSPRDYVFGSSHTNGLNIALADGSVRFIPNAINLTVLKHLVDRKDGQAINAY